MLLGSPRQGGGERDGDWRPAAPVVTAADQTAAVDTLDHVDWRRRVFALYAQVRACDDPAAAHELWRRGRNDLFAHHPSSPLKVDERGGFTGLRVAPYDPAYRFEVALAPAGPRRWQVETGTDGTVDFELVGVADLGELGRLDVWRLASYGNGVFVPLKDGLSGRAGGGYGGGRYVVDTVKGADLGSHDSRIVLDLNFAYAPSCAYDPAWACPLAPPGNTLAGDVPVGELTP